MRLFELQEILKKYKNGTASQEEIRLVEVWFLRTEKEPAIFSPEELAKTEEQIFNRLRTSIPFPQRQPNLMRRLFRIPLLRVASILVLVAGAGITAWQYRHSIEGLFDPVEMKVVQSGAYDIKQVWLPDSTLVTLHHNSSIRFPSKYRGRLREVTLSGKGFFDVTKDPDHPFVVHSEDIDVQVLGTSFVVDDRLQESSVTVSVLTGKVDVSRQRQSLAILTPNKSISYQRHSGKYSIEDLDARSLVAWVNKQLVFEKTDLIEVLEALKLQYHVTIHVQNDKIKGKVFTGEFTSKDSLQQVLEIIAVSTGMTYQQPNDSTITINP